MTSLRRGWVGLLLGLAGVLLTGCTLGGNRGATINTLAQTVRAADCPPATAPGLDATQEANAKIVVGVVLGRGLGRTGAAIAVAAALAESSLYNYANDGTSTLIGSAEHRQLNDTERAVARESLTYPHDKVGNNLDSIGLFQQRPMAGWGTPDQLINPATATGKFLDQMVKVADWQTLSPWTAAQKVQGSSSSDGGIYRDSYKQATSIVAALNTTAGSASTTSSASVVAQAGAGSTCGQPAAASSAGVGSAAWGGYQNGRIPATALCPVPSAPALQLQCGAATAFDQLNTRSRPPSGKTSASPTVTAPTTNKSSADWTRAACAPTPAPPTTAGAKPSTSAAAAASTAAPAPRSTGSPPTPAATAGTTPPGHEPAAPNPNRGTGSTAPSHEPRRPGRRDLQESQHRRKGRRPIGRKNR